MAIVVVKVLLFSCITKAFLDGKLPMEKANVLKYVRHYFKIMNLEVASPVTCTSVSSLSFCSLSADHFVWRYTGLNGQCTLIVLVLLNFSGVFIPLTIKLSDTEAPISIYTQEIP